MEKNFVIRILISIVFVFIPTFALAQDDEPAIKIKTEVYDGGITVETYEKGTKEYKVFRKKNGDYYMDIEPYEMRWTLKDKTLIKGNNNDLRIKFPNGNVLFMKYDKYSQPVHQYYLLQDPDLPTLWNHFSESRMIGFEDVNNHPGTTYPIKHTNGLHYVPIGNNIFDFDLNGKLNYIGKEVIGIDKTHKQPRKFKCFVYAIPTDSIIECVKEMDPKGEKGEYIKISYANGDEVFSSNSELREGTHIHRENGVLKIKEADNGYCFYYFYFNDGRIFKGKMNNCFKEIYDPNSWESGDMTSKVLCYPSLTPYTGMLINKDNTGIVIEKGMTQEEIEKQKELTRKKEEANKKAGYDLLCKAYGKKYVDAAMKGNLIIGMPVDLFLLGYPNTRLRQQSQGTKVYEVRNILNKITKVVRVRNGRVSGVTNY